MRPRGLVLVAAVPLQTNRLWFCFALPLASTTLRLAAPSGIHTGHAPVPLRSKVVC